MEQLALPLERQSKRVRPTGDGELTLRIIIAVNMLLVAVAIAFKIAAPVAPRATDDHDRAYKRTVKEGPRPQPGRRY